MGGSATAPSLLFRLFLCYVVEADKCSNFMGNKSNFSLRDLQRER